MRGPWPETLADVAGALGVPASPSVAFAGVAIDSRTVGRGELFFAINGPRFDGHDFLADVHGRGAAGAVVHRAVEAPRDLPLLRVEDTTQALGRLAHHVRAASDVAMVAVTGSVGKTTTKEMVAALLAFLGPVLKTEGNLNNRYGVPLSLLGLRREHKAAALELGMSARGELRSLSLIARPDVAVITNVGSAHLEFFTSPEEIAEAKAEILEGIGPKGRGVLNRDDARVRKIGEGRGDVIWFGLQAGCDVSASDLRVEAGRTHFELYLHGRSLEATIPLVGNHFLLDFLAAAAAAHALGVPAEAIVHAAASLRAQRGRGAIRRLGADVLLVDDTYNSSPEALEAAVSSLSAQAPRRRVAVLGDMLELGTRASGLHRLSGERLAGLVDLLVAVGPLSHQFALGARAAGFVDSAIQEFPDAGAAAGPVASLIQGGDAVLVKGSRGMRMERIVDALSARFGEA